MEIGSLIETLSWRDVLYEVISRMDPWDVDIVEVATRYSQRVEEMQRMDFKLPANVILVSSILLRMKSYAIRFTEFEEVEVYDEGWSEEGFEEDIEYAPDTNKFEFINDLTTYHDFDDVLISRRVPKRRITANELIAAIQEILGDKRVKREKIIKEIKPLVMPHNPDIKRLIDELYSKIMGMLSERGPKVIRFSELIKDKTHIRMIRTFISLLHLANDQR